VWSAARSASTCDERTAAGESVSTSAHAEQLAFTAAERPGPVHQGLVELPVLALHGRMHGVDLDDVVGVGDAVAGRERVGCDVGDEGNR